MAKPESGSLTLTQAPECIAELKRAAEQIDAAERVAAFVVMESAPLVDRFQSITEVPAASEKKLLAEQNRVVEQIEKNVLPGTELEIRYQFTYLTNSFSIRTEFKNLAEIAKLDGVKSVFIMPVYNPCTV